MVCTVAQRIHHGVKLAPNWAETKVEKTERPAAGSQEDAASENSCRWMISKVDKLTVGKQGNIDKSFLFHDDFKPFVFLQNWKLRKRHPLS